MSHAPQSSAETIPHRPVDRIVAALLLGTGIAILFAEAWFRTGEADVAAAVLRWTGQGHAVALGPTVFFTHRGEWIGYVVATGCTAALLIAPFFFLAAGLLFVGRLSLQRTLLSLLAIAVLIAGINQARLWLIGASMRHWGFQTGYDRSHVLAGGVLSTVGVALGLVMLAVVTLRGRRYHTPQS